MDSERETLIASMSDEEFMALKKREFPDRFAEIQSLTALCEQDVQRLEQELKAAKADRRCARAYEKRVRNRAIDAGWLEKGEPGWGRSPRDDHNPHPRGSMILLPR
jgi:hypothetical protein